MKTIKEYKEIERRLVKEELERQWVDMTTEYWYRTAKDWILENIKELWRLWVDMATEYWYRTAKYWRLENIEELWRLWVDMTTEYWNGLSKISIEVLKQKEEEMTLKEICKELGRDIKIVK